MKSNLVTQIIIIVVSALIMYGGSYFGSLQSVKKNYHPSVMPTLNLLASALLLTMLISEESEKTVNNFNWLTGMIVLIILIGCNYLSPKDVSTLSLQIKSKSNLKNVIDDWNKNITNTKKELYFGENIAYQNKMIQQLTSELKNGSLTNDTLSVNIEYDKAIDEGDKSNELRVIQFIQDVLGRKYSIHTNINKPNGISVGLVVAVVINFVMDGLLAGNEIDYSSQTSSGFFKVGYMKLNNIFGFIFDNVILMLILGYQFSRSSMSKTKQMLSLGLIVLSFVISMTIGMFTPISSSINQSISDTIVFVVVAYTVFVELLPDSILFEDYYGRDIQTDNPEDPYMMTHDSFYIKNYKNAFMPLILFGGFFLYKKLTNYLE